MHQAAQMSRMRGRIVLTGVVGLDLQRADFYDKELTFQVSCSYGPGRSDPAYEDEGHDYPFGYVRWTENRNFEAVLDLMADDRLVVDELTTSRVSFDRASTAYESLDSSDEIGILMTYEADQAPADFLNQRSVVIQPAPRKPSSAVIGVVGAGNFAKAALIPGFIAAGARLKYIASSGGVSGSAVARKFDIEQSTTDNAAIFADDDVDAVAITTRHNSHAPLVVAALDANKDVFVEKPLALNARELHEIGLAYDRAGERRGNEPLLMVGFNRRFAPATVKLRALLAGRQGPIAATYVANAGAIPSNHWTQDPQIGGGRIIGEACHFIDYLHYLVGEQIISVNASGASGSTQPNLEDIVSVQLEFSDGSIGTVHYFANGAKALVKERCEIFFDGNVLQMDNFKSVKAFGSVSTPRPKLAAKQEKGHAEQFAAFVGALRSGSDAPIPFWSLRNVTEASFAAVESMRGAGRIALAG